MRHALLIRGILLALFIILIGACGEKEGDIELTDTVSIPTIPIITRIDPTTGPVGTALTIFGMGFSIIPEENEISIGATVVAAGTYELTDGTIEGEIERITLTVPEGVGIGEQAVVVTVNGNASNSNQTFTVTP